jgi:hypothetical protein
MGICSDPGVEAVVEASISIQASDAVSESAVEASEQTSDDNFPIWLNGNCSDFVIYSDPGVEAVVEAPINIQASDAVSGNAVAREGTAYDNFPIWLYATCTD